MAAAPADEPGGASRGPPTPTWVRVVLWLDLVGILGFAVFVFLEPAYDPSDVWANRVAGVFLLVPYLLVAVKMRDAPPWWLYGAAIVTTLTVAGLLTYLFPRVAAGAGFNPSTALGPKTILSMLGAIGIQFVVFLWSCVTVRKGDATARRAALYGMAATWVWPIVYITLGSSLGNTIEIHMIARRSASEQDLRHAVVATTACALQYAATHRGTYPASLDAMGPAGTRCLDRGVIAARDRLGLDYRASGDAAAFVVHGAVLSALLRPGEKLSVWGDTSAAVRTNIYSAQGDTIERVVGDGIPASLGRVRDCVDALRRSTGRLPTAEDLRAGRGSARALERVGCDLSGARVVLGDSAQTQRRGYRIGYQVDGAAYRLEARPLGYGVTGLRSYLLTSDGRLFVTRADRGATADDPELPPCAPYDWGDCAPTPATELPRAAFVHDTEVRDHEPYRLAVRVLGDAGHIPVRMEWRFDCDVAPGDTATPVITSFGPRRADESCPLLTGSRLGPARDGVVVRLWLKSPSGTVTRVQDTVAVRHAP